MYSLPHEQGFSRSRDYTFRSIYGLQFDAILPRMNPKSNARRAAAVRARSVSIRKLTAAAETLVK